MARFGSSAIVLRALVAAALAVSTLGALGCAGKPESERAGAGAVPGAIVSSEQAPSAIPFGPPPPPPLGRPLRVLVGGDLLPHRPSLVAPAAIHAALAPLAPLFAQADAVVANYEAATGDVDPKAFRLAYAAPRGWLEELPKAGLRAVSVANNHTCDLGEAGLDATLEGASAGGLLALGADAADPWAPRAIVEQSGKRICAVAWTTFSNSVGPCARSRHLAVAPLSVVGKQRIDRALARAKTRCDATIAIFHGGEEYAPQTSAVMDQAAHAAEAGADAVIIHHPHIASPVVLHTTRDGRSVPLFASVGNLVTNQGESWKPPMFPVLRENRHLVCVNGWTRLGVLADLSFTFEEKRTRLDWGMHLLWIENEHAEDRSVATPKIEARLLEPARDRAIIDKLSEDAVGPRALFSDPCWFERDGAEAAAGAGKRDDRCSGAFDLARRAAPSPAADARPKKHGPRPRAGAAR
jgi:poly-gamma-glutamate synthesis protein (capsule biosynthesis protein)